MILPCFGVIVLLGQVILENIFGADAAKWLAGGRDIKAEQEDAELDAELDTMMSYGFAFVVLIIGFTAVYWLNLA